MIIALIACLLCIGFISYHLYKKHKELSKFSILIPIQVQKEQLEKDIKFLGEKLKSIDEDFDNKTKVLLEVRNLELGKKTIELNQIQIQVKAKNILIDKLDKEIKKLQMTKDTLENEKDLVEMSFYSPKYNFLNSEKYKEKLEFIKDEQKALIFAKTAIRCDTKWTVSGSAIEGERMTNQNIKLGLSSYNGQVDNIILTVGFKNIDRCEEKINKIKDSVNNMMKSAKCDVTEKYHKLKIQELYLAYEYELKLYEEKEEQKKIRLKMQEEEREIRAIEKAKSEAEKEESEYLKQLIKAKKEFEKGHAEEREGWALKIQELESKLVEASEKKERAISMAMQTKRGHVYIISNIGSFGENVFKIGMTRRLDPQDRVDELGDASVPFAFDVHGMIYSEDAPALEHQLHKIFGEHTVNKMNVRKEFFKVSINEIQKECNNFGLKVELTKIAEARDYRQSVEMKNNPYKKAA
jgi:hypothetical protein